MAKKKIVSIGFELASNDVQYCSFDSDMSLLDWDIILFKPNISSFTMYQHETYQGKISLTESKSFSFKERCEHWRREITDAFQNNKTVIIFLTDLEEIYIDSGKREYSGTGKNQKTTRLVKLINNYYSFPFDVKPEKRKGSSITVSQNEADVITEYWNAFKGISEYKVTIGKENISECLITRNGKKPVGIIVRSEESNGSLVLLPDIDFYHERFVKGDDLEQEWTKSAPIFAINFIKEIISIDKKLHNTGEVTPAPNWSLEKDYSFNIENEIREKLLIIENELERITREKEQKKEELIKYIMYRGLLYEKGKPLEKSIIASLKILGFNAKTYNDGKSEFDVVFESEEGRLIGEAEGKDNKAINIDKLRQLSMNIYEDLERESVTEQAKGVLFGNAHRLLYPSNRENIFTEKCISSSKTSSVALVSTIDLFKAVRYLINKPNSDFATSCRRKILDTIGIVEFPEIEQEELIIEDKSEE